MGDRGSANNRGYNYRWQQSSKLFLAKNPLCRFCADLGMTTAAEVVDHIIPHKGDEQLFWDVNNWQGLCVPCHNITKQRMERSGLKRIGLDGWPLEDNNKENDDG